MGMRFERDVGGRPACFLARRIEGDHFRVRNTVVSVETFADDLVICDDHAANERIRADKADPL